MHILYCITKWYNYKWNDSYVSLQKAANGQVAAEKTSPAKKTSATKAEAPKKTTAVKAEEIDGKLAERKQDDNKAATTKKEKEQISAKAGKENKIEQVKNKKNLKNLFQERPADFDDGWLFYMYIVCDWSGFWVARIMINLLSCNSLRTSFTEN